MTLDRIPKIERNRSWGGSKFRPLFAVHLKSWSGVHIITWFKHLVPCFIKFQLSILPILGFTQKC